MACYLSEARYGKDKVRLFRVVREDKTMHQIVEYDVQVLLEGDMERRQASASPFRPGWFYFILMRMNSYTEADNSAVVATDSIKNVTYCAWTCENVREEKSD